MRFSTSALEGGAPGRFLAARSLAHREFGPWTAARCEVREQAWPAVRIPKSARFLLGIGCAAVSAGAWPNGVTLVRSGRVRSLVDAGWWESDFKLTRGRASHWLKRSPLPGSIRLLSPIWPSRPFAPGSAAQTLHGWLTFGAGKSCAAQKLSLPRGGQAAMVQWKAPSSCGGRVYRHHGERNGASGALARIHRPTLGACAQRSARVRR